MFEQDILQHVKDGNEHSIDGIAAALGCVPFLLQTSIDGLVLSGKLTARDGQPRMYSSRTVKSRLLELDQTVDDMQAQREPGFIEANGWEYDPFDNPREGEVTPCASPIRWMGGKSKMLTWLLQRYPEHYAYCEVFGGSCKPLFGKKPSPIEIVNDKYDSLINFWRICALWPEELCASVNALPASRLYQRWFQRSYAHRNPFERAVMFGYLSLHSYNGLVWKPFAGSSHQPPGSLNPAIVKAAAERLRGVVIESQDFRAFIDRYCMKRPAAGKVFTYMDPPYLKTEGYALKFPDMWHQELAAKMVEINEAGNLVMMTNSNVAGEAYMDWFGSDKSGFTVEYVDVDYTLGHSESRGARKEAVISNFKLQQKQGKLF